jgi:hypothetical protein
MDSDGVLETNDEDDKKRFTDRINSLEVEKYLFLKSTGSYYVNFDNGTPIHINSDTTKGTGSYKAKYGTYIYLDDAYAVYVTVLTFMFIKM